MMPLKSTMSATTTTRGTGGEGQETDLAKRIGRLIHGQSYGVLCTQSDSQPYGSLVALAESSALFRVEVVRYFHVCHFQEVRQWIPNRTS